MAIPLSPPGSFLKRLVFSHQEHSWKEKIGWAVVLSLSVLVFAMTVVGLCQQWRGDASLSHGPLLLIIALGLLWLRKTELRQLRWNDTAPAGLACLVLTVLLHLFAVWADVAFLKPLSALGILVGGAWYLGGSGAAKWAAGPIGLLAWAIPWPTTLVSSLAFPLQLMSSAYAALFAGTLGLSIHREGVHLSVMPETGNKPIYSILVAAQCSGLTSLMVLLAFGYLVAYFTPARLLGKILLIIAVVPLAILANAVRLTIILLVGGLWSVHWAQWVHDNEQPVLVFLCSFGLLGLRHLIISWLPEQVVERVPAQAAVSKPEDFRQPRTSKPLFVASVLLLMTLGNHFWAWHTALPDSATGNGVDYLQNITTPFRNWTTSNQVLTAHERELLLPDAVLLKQYHSSSGEEANVAVLAGHRKQTVHTPAFCMAGGGWNTLSEANIMLKLPNETVPAVRAEMENHGQRLLITYFFTNGTQSEQSLVSFQIHQFMGRITGTPPMGALVRVIVPIVEDKSRAQVLSDEFSHAVLPPILQRLREAGSKGGLESR